VSDPLPMNATVQIPNKKIIVYLVKKKLIKIFIAYLEEKKASNIFTWLLHIANTRQKN
jgi:hypothetical protein